LEAKALQYRTYGKTGLKLSALGYGAMRLPKDEELAVQCLTRFLDLGGNFIDTARGYSESERLVGQAIAGRRDQVVISTKNAALAPLRWKPGYVYTDDMWQEAMDKSFATLGVDYIDLYHVHDFSWDHFTEYFMKPGGPMDMVRPYLDNGSIRHLCFSSHDTPENMMKLVDEGVFDGILLQYNLLDRRNEDVIAHAHEEGLGVNVMGPVAGGRLAHASDRLTGMVAGVDTVPEIAIRFVLNNDHVTSALSGMNSLAMVEENFATASREEPLTPEEYQMVVQTLAENQKLLDLYCTGCEYCLPCPQGVAIPQVLQALNLERVWGLTDLARQGYAKLSSGETVSDASLCVECGECEGKCPQHLSIMAELQEAHELLS
jgi:uncharacterized protein